MELEVELKSGVSHKDCFTRHFEVQKQKYGQQVIINLIDQKGAEGRLETQLKAVCNQVSDADLFYEAFDFHKECSKMRYDKLQTLMDRLAPEDRAGTSGQTASTVWTEPTWSRS